MVPTCRCRSPAAATKICIPSSCSSSMPRNRFHPRPPSRKQRLTPLRRRRLANEVHQAMQIVRRIALALMLLVVFAHPSYAVTRDTLSSPRAGEGFSSIRWLEEFSARRASRLRSARGKSRSVEKRNAHPANMRDDFGISSFAEHDQAETIWKREVVQGAVDSAC